MNAHLWELAGPRLFVDRIASATQAGKSVIIITNQGNLVPEIARNVALGMNRIDLPNIHLGPVAGDPLTSLLGGISEGEGALTLRRLLDRAAGRTFVAAAPAVSAGWLDFMLRFQHGTRSQPIEHRPRIVLAVAGTGRSEVDEVALEHHNWDDVVSSADLESLVLGRLPRDTALGTLRRVLARTVVEVASGDLKLVDKLCLLGRADLAAPHAFLEQWVARGTSQHTLIWVDSEMRSHPIRAAPTEFRRQIGNRVWRAQAGVLLPWVEEYRVKFLPLVQELLPPFDDFRIPRAEFEVGPICYLLRRNHPACRFLPLFDRLRKVRNQMAHCRALTFDELYSDIGYVENYR